MPEGQIKLPFGNCNFDHIIKIMDALYLLIFLYTMKNTAEFHHHFAIKNSWSQVRLHSEKTSL